MTFHFTDKPAMQTARAQGRRGGSVALTITDFLRRLALAALLGVLAVRGSPWAWAAPPTGPLRHKPLKVNDLPGESEVPGFPATPAKLSPEYIAAFMAAEADEPSENRMLHAFNHPDMGIPLVTFLPRYRSPRLIVPTRKLARAAPQPAVQAGAVGGLIGALDDTPDTRLLVRGLLRSPHPVVRDRAAEYLRWLGTDAELPHLNRQAASERDLHARAAMIEAAAAITRRAALFTAGPAVLEAAAGTPAAVYRKCADALGDGATTGTRATAIRLIRGAELCEPIHRYGGRSDDPARGEALLAAHRLLAGYPESPTASEGPDTLPVASTVVPPVRGYADPSRKSYGILIKPELGSPFTGKHHVGDDCAWQQDHATVVAIAAGVVRQVDLGMRSWGGLVVIEHRDPRGNSYCSLYGHLGPLVCVQAGETVKAGRKLGSVGVSYTYAAGGYLAHLHFGIHRSAFLVPDRAGEPFVMAGPSGEALAATVESIEDWWATLRLPDGSIRKVNRTASWVCGYLSPDDYRSPSNRWTDPQAFLGGYRR